MRRHLSISLAAKVMVPLALLGVVAATTGVWYTHREYDRRFDEEAVKRGDLLTHAVEHTANVADSVGLRRVVAALGADRDVRRIVVAAGTPPVVVAATRNAWIGTPIGRLPEDIRTPLHHAMETSGGDHHLQDNGRNAAVITIGARLLVRPEAPDGADFSDMAAVVELDRSRFRSGLAEASRNQLLVLLAIIGAITLGALALFRMTILRRLGAISAVLRRRGTGEPVLAPVTSRDAIGRLAASLNEAFHAVSESAERTRAIIDNAAEGIITIDDHGVVESFNAAAERMFGYDSAEAVGREVALLMPASYRAAHQAALARARLQDERRPDLIANELEGLRKDGSLFPLAISVSEVRVDGRRMFTAVLRDVSEHKALEEQLEHQATHDGLTDLPNRVLLLDRLEHALARAGRLGVSTAVLFIDMDRLKVVNDGLGHDTGDRLLVEAANRVRDAVRSADTVARFGGDEFAVLCEDVTDVGAVVALARRVMERMRPPFEVDGNQLYATASIGIAVGTGDGDTAADVLRKADVAMYRAKAAGGNQYAMFDAEMQAWADVRLDTENALHHALERNEMSLHYQPLVDLATGRVSGVEALLRWTRPEVGPVPPVAFIPVAEETGLIAPIGAWVLEVACATAARWGADRPAARLEIGVNVSARQLLRSDFVDTVAGALARSGLAPDRLVLEITESVLLHDTPTAIATLHRIKSLGVRLSLDDFGTGHSSLQYLQNFPIDIVKIDQSFVRDVATGAGGSTIVGAVVALAHGLGLQVVAEGVETEDQAAALLRLGCDSAQGFFFARPAPADVVEDLLGEHLGREARPTVP